MGKTPTMTWLLPALLLHPTIQTAWPRSKPETTNYHATSSYEDTIGFIKQLQAAGSPLTLQFIGESFEKRPIPQVVISYPQISTPEEARASRKPVVYLQGNIHAGEVEGKEAALHFMRRLAQEAADLKAGKRPKDTLVDKLIFVVNPIYNADGNEKWGPVDRNRPEQDGPDIVGVRPNGQGFDLNRDCIKVESPEMSSAIPEVYEKWKPHVMMDLHTTDGTRHGYDMTWASPQNPVTEPSLLAYGRDTMMGSIKRAFRDAYKQEIFEYGNAVRGRDGTTRWETFGHEGRYVTNYAGLRNCIGLLSEAATYISFKDRILATERYVTKTMEYVAAHANEITSLIEQTNRKVMGWAKSNPEIGLRYKMESRGEDTLLLEAPPGKRDKRPDKLIKVKGKVFERFVSTKTSKYPAGWFVPASETATLAMLRKHGIQTQGMTEDWTGISSGFTVETARQAGSAFQGHRIATIDGKWERRWQRVAKGSVFVTGAQPLGALAFHILEPESTDGAAAWNFITLPKVGARFPVTKIFSDSTLPR